MGDVGMRTHQLMRIRPEASALLLAADAVVWVHNALGLLAG